jgi:hypothetical protein
MQGSVSTKKLNCCSDQSFNSYDSKYQTLYNAKSHKFVANNGRLSCIQKDCVIENKVIKGGALPLSKSPKK